MPKKCCFSCFSLKSANRSGAFFDFCVCVPKIVQSYFSSQSFSRKIVQSFNSKIVQSFSRSVVQSFSRSTTYIYIYCRNGLFCGTWYWAVHGTWRYMVLGTTWYYAMQGTAQGMVLCNARLAIFPDTFLYQLLKQYANISKKSIRTMPKAKKCK